MANETGNLLGHRLLIMFPFLELEQQTNIHQSVLTAVVTGINYLPLLHLHLQHGCCLLSFFFSFFS